MERERKVTPGCINASNPFHVCGEYCVQRSHGSNPRSPLLNLAQNGGIHEENQGFAIAERNVNSSCLNATNPYHQCAEYCSPRKSKEVKGQNKEKSSVENGVKMQDNRMVQREQIHTNCVNASNPYHKCVEHCFQEISQSS
ncbi:hypothetical protein MUK42_02175 [Musa troglodytarum]|uniref:Uncharacterized protein n=1 Tax=Musa troglodytarum TaxID=320322 RepID=A0A9E7JE95_9LILI|nr:hypothetical protein MUK42_02175 [Musa troglodytarum]